MKPVYKLIRNKPRNSLVSVIDNKIPRKAINKVILEGLPSNSTHPLDAIQRGIEVDLGIRIHGGFIHEAG